MVSKSTGMLAVVAAVAAVGVGAAYALSKASGLAQLFAILPNGTEVQGTVTYSTTDNESFATVVPPTTQPSTIQGFDTNTATGVTIKGTVFPWDVNTTGYTYIIQGIPKPVGTYLIWTVTSFSDGSTSKSNVLTVKVE